MTTILATLDGSELSLQILPVVAKLAGEQKATVRLLRVITRPSGASGESYGEIVPDGVGHSATLAFTTVERLGPPGAESDWQEFNRVLHEARDYLENAAQPLRDSGVEVDVVVEVAGTGGVAEAIIAQASMHAVDFIAMSTHGRGGLRQTVQGSVSADVLRAGVAPVILVKPLVK
jgi:nucleotide-binding universal stress UspA family protein